MRVNYLEINGVSYPMCFSLRTMTACGERYGSIGGIDAALSPKSEGDGDSMKVLTECVWLLSQMLDAGARHERLQGKEPAVPPTEDMLLDLWGLEDFTELKLKLMAAISGSNERTVETEAPKNAGAAPEP